MVLYVAPCCCESDNAQILVLGMKSEFSEPEVDSQEEIQETREAGCTPKPKPESCMCASTCYA